MYFHTGNKHVFRTYIPLVTSQLKDPDYCSVFPSPFFFFFHISFPLFLLFRQIMEEWLYKSKYAQKTLQKDVT